MTTSEQARMACGYSYANGTFCSEPEPHEHAGDADHECSACGGTGNFYFGQDAKLPYVPGDAIDCPVCLGAGRISDRMPVADAIADAETLRRYLRQTMTSSVWRFDSGLCYRWPSKRIPIPDPVSAWSRAHAAFRECPGLRG
jgi:hypothetical protein